MNQPKTVKILAFHADRCKGCLACEKACSQVHFKTNAGGDQSALRITKTDQGYQMHVCDQRGLCLDLCPVGALRRQKNGVVVLDPKICVGCQACVAFCPIGAMRKSKLRLEPFKCISCGSCVRACPEKALELVERNIAEIKQIVYHKQGV
ncbi:MAG: 4Fe-4S binding protein [Candidatus Thermoplasmatota archaeon]